MTGMARGGSATEDPLQLLHDVDELLTTNLERWEGINNGVCRVIACRWGGVPVPVPVSGGSRAHPFTRVWVGAVAVC